jgi:hypothetical protein
LFENPCPGIQNKDAVPLSSNPDFTLAVLQHAIDGGHQWTGNNKRNGLPVVTI